MSHPTNSRLDLTCYLIDDRPVDIRPARNRREWMNQTPGAYAYRCLPLSIANAHGWEARCPSTFEAEWNGGPGKDDIDVVFEDDEGPLAGSAKRPAFVESHFGSGIITFNVGVVVATPPGYDLWVSGPANEFKDGIQALSAVVETYWMPFTFTMNWKFTRPQLKVRFEKGDSFCFFFPVEHALLERFDPALEEIGEGSDLEKQFKRAQSKRSLVVALDRLDNGQLKLEEKDRFDGWYIRGEMPDGSAEISDHKKRLQVKPFGRR